MYKLEQKDNELYEQEIRSTTKQAVGVKISFGITADDANNNNDLTAPELSSIGNVVGIVGEQTEFEKTYATFEQDLWLLDGSRKLKGQGKQPQDNAGLILEPLDLDSTYDNAFDHPLAIFIRLDNIQNFLGLRITFSQLLGEYAKDFDIVKFDDNGTYTLVEEVRNNTSVEYQSEAGYDAVRTIEIVIYRWSKSHRRARIENVIFGLNVVFGDKDLTHTELINEFNPLSLQLPISQLSFTIIDPTDSFDADNPQGRYRYLVQNQRVRVDYYQRVADDKIIEIQGGYFFLSGWEQADSDLSYNFTASDLLFMLDRTNYHKGREQTVTAYDLLHEIVDDANLPLMAQGLFVVDESLKAIQLQAMIPIATHRDALQLVANACCVVVTVDRQGVVHVEPRKDELLDYTLDHSLIMNRPPKPERRSPLHAVTVAYRSFSADNQQTSEIEVQGDGQPRIAVIEYGGAGRLISATIQGGTIISTKGFAFACEIEFVTTGTVVITITNTRLNEVSTEHKVYGSDQFGQRQDGDTLAIDNPLIVSLQQARQVADWVLWEASHRRLYEIDAVADMRLDVGDNIQLATRFIPDLPARITSIKTVVGSSDEMRVLAMRDIV